MSHWFYLLVSGGSGTNDIGNSYTVNSIGTNLASAIVYRVETVYLTSSSNYSNFRTYSIQAARDISGANSCAEIAVTNAWFAVGVGAAYNFNNLYTISGSARWCTGSQQFTLTGPTGVSNNTWSVSRPNFVTINPTTGTTTTLTKTNNNNANLIATFTYAGTCGSYPASVSRQIIVGTPVMTDGTYDNDYNHFQNTLATTNLVSAPSSQIVHINAYPGAPGATSYTWSRTSGSAPWTQSQGVLTLTLGGTSTGYGTSATFHVVMTSTCGNSTFDPTFALTGGPGFTISPNPAQILLVLFRKIKVD